MNNFYFTLPFAFDDMQERNKTDKENISWLFASPAVRAYWKIIGVKIDIFAQIAYSSANLGLEKDFYERFSCQKINHDCLCAQPIEKRYCRKRRTFLQADCDFASLKLEGPFFKDDNNSLPFLEQEFGFCVDFSFNWNGIIATTDPPEDDSNVLVVHEAGLESGSTVPIYCIDTTSSTSEMKYIDINIDYIYDDNY